MISFRDIERRPVCGAAGALFGDLDDVLLDEHTWRIVSFVVRLDSGAVVSLGLEKPFWRRARLTIPSELAREENGIIVLSMTIDEFGRLLGSELLDADVL